MRDFLFIAAVLCIPLVGPSPVQAQAPDARTVTVSGEGEIDRAPDRAVVRFGIVTEAEEAEEARTQNATAAREAMNAVRGLGIAEERIRLASIRLQPRREYDPETETRKQMGYEATRQVIVEVDSLDRLPALVTRAVQAGANRLDGVDYELRDRAAARNEALRQAAQNAQDKARLLAETLSASLGPARTIQEQSFSFDRPTLRTETTYQAKRTSADAAAPEPDAYAAGQITVSAQVQVVFGLATP
jgi:uncharacterized protein YggE